MAWIAPVAGSLASAYAKTNSSSGLREETTANGATFANQFDHSGWVVNTGGGTMRDVEVSGSNQSQPVSTSPSAGKGGGTLASLLPNEFSSAVSGDNTVLLIAGGAALVVLLLVMRKRKK